MADIHIEREHALGLHEARKIAFRWAEQAEAEFDMECTYEEGKASDLVSFRRSGVHGTLAVTQDRFQDTDPTPSPDGRWTNGELRSRPRCR